MTETYTITTVIPGNERGTIGGETAPSVTQKAERERGFIAIIEEGDAFASVRANLQQAGWAGASGTIVYNTVFSLFTVKSCRRRWKNQR